MKKDERIIRQTDLPFHKVRSKPVKQNKSREKGTSIANVAAKAVLGAALTGDPTGAVAGVVVDQVVDKIIR